VEDQRKLNFHVLQPGFPTLTGDVTKGYVMRLTSQQVAMVRLSAQQSSDLIGAIQDAAAHALGFSQALAVAGQTDSALHFEHQRARLADLERLLTADGKRPVAVELM
jgi:hypothetical protein